MHTCAFYNLFKFNNAYLFILERPVPVQKCLIMTRLIVASSYQHFTFRKEVLGSVLQLGSLMSITRTNNALQTELPYGNPISSEKLHPARIPDLIQCQGVTRHRHRLNSSSQCVHNCLSTINPSDNLNHSQRFKSKVGRIVLLTVWNAGATDNIDCKFS